MILEEEMREKGRGEVAGEVMFVAFLENVDLVGPFVPAFSQVTPSLYPEFS